MQIFDHHSVMEEISVKKEKVIKGCCQDVKTECSLICCPAGDVRADQRDSIRN